MLGPVGWAGVVWSGVGVAMKQTKGMLSRNTWEILEVFGEKYCAPWTLPSTSYMYGVGGELKIMKWLFSELSIETFKKMLLSVNVSQNSH